VPLNRLATGSEQRTLAEKHDPDRRPGAIWRYRRFVDEAHARALISALEDEFSHATGDAWVLSRRASVESYTASQTHDGSWLVTFLWQQGDHRFGFVVREVDDAVVAGLPTPERAALDLRMFFVEEPHAPVGVRDDTGRYWLTD
jgi:hypothetical protein